METDLAIAERDDILADGCEGVPGEGSQDPSAPAHIVIGSGPAGTRAAQELARRTAEPVRLFGDERWGSYNRVKLTPLLAGEVNLGQINQRLDIGAGATCIRHDGTRITAIDREARVVRDTRGTAFPYLTVTIATGSRVFRPPIPGIDCQHVYFFRSLDDVEQLLARTQTSRNCVVIGGGLLGLEAARGMHLRGTAVTIVENEPWLMARQLDRAGGELLAEQIRALGIGVRVSTNVREIVAQTEGSRSVTHLQLSGEETLACDTVIVCTGVRPNKEIALEAGLAVGRGITVTRDMRTTDPDIFAVGECAEYGGNLEGLVAPGLEQARVAAKNATGGSDAFTRNEPTTRLKVVGAPVFSAGDVEQADQRSDLDSHLWREGALYRRLLTKRGRLVGAIAVGEWDGIGHVQQLVQNRARIGRLALRGFARTGDLPGQDLPDAIALWPAATTVCNCTGVTRGQLGEAMARGCATAEALARETSASTVCGTCKPLLQELTGSDAAPEPAKAARPILILSLLAVLGAALYAALPGLSTEQSYDPGLTLGDFFVDGFLKQVTGFTLLGLSVIAAILSLRRRVKWLNFGDYAIWRVIHLVLGVVAVGTLVIHSGFSLGSNLNAVLMICFLGVIAAGALAGAAIATEHKLAALGPVKQRKAKPRDWSWWLHMLFLWPLPVLLLIHIATVYFY